MKENKQNDVKSLILSFQGKFERRQGYRPVISWGKDGRLLKMRLNDYSSDQIEELFDYFLDSEKSYQHPTIASSLSADTINKWLQKKQNEKWIF